MKPVVKLLSQPAPSYSSLPRKTQSILFPCGRRRNVRTYKATGKIIVPTYICNVCICLPTYVCMYVCMYVGTYVCMCACVCIHDIYM
jgi:hypothetical protein